MPGTEQVETAGVGTVATSTTAVVSIGAVVVGRTIDVDDVVGIIVVVFATVVGAGAVVL